MSKILVTGGAGYIGSVLVPMLLKEGHEVTVLDNFYFNQSTLLECCMDPNFHVVRGDARKEGLMKELMEGKDYIIPLAAMVGFPLCKADEVAAETTNLGAVKTILKLRKPGQRIIYPCTNSGYGVGEGDKFCTEDTPMRPISLYGTTKAEAEQLPLRKKLAIERDISIVCVGDPTDPADSVACCGTHPKFAGQIGLIKIWKVEANKGMFRVYCEAGQRALQDYDTKHEILTKLNHKYSANTYDLL